MQSYHRGFYLLKERNNTDGIVLILIPGRKFPKELEDELKPGPKSKTLSLVHVDVHKVSPCITPAR